jgi:murein DD-endopeptidase MepM/ murein hydrolase activator NlpD
MLLFSLVTLWPLTAQYPEIKELNALHDSVFRQFEQHMARNYRILANGSDPGLPFLFRYKIKNGDELFSIAARLNLPYDTLATLNNLAGPQALRPGSQILIPTIPGIYVPEDLSTIYAQARSGSYSPDTKTFTLLRGSEQRQKWHLFPGARFNQLERAFFLGILFQFPISSARISSTFGPRPNPFTGKPSFHRGMDFAAPQGTEIRPARPGKVVEAGFDRIYGNHVIIDHDGTYQTLYGHMQKFFVRLNQQVTSTTILGVVGSTGYSTGPHLHFEILKDGKPIDPNKLLR